MKKRLILKHHVICLVALICLTMTSGVSLAEVTVSTGFTVEEFATISNPRALAFGPGGSFGTDLYVISYSGQAYGNTTIDTPCPSCEKIYTVSSDGTLSATPFVELYPETDPAALEFLPGGSSTFPDVLYVSSNNRDDNLLGDRGGTIQLVNSSGVFSDFTQVGLDPTDFGLGEPVGMAFATGGDFGTNLFVANSCDVSADIFQVDVTGDLSEFLDDNLNVLGAGCPTGTGYAPTDLAFGPGAGFGTDLFFVDIGADYECIQTVNISKIVTKFVDLPGPPRDLIFAPGGAFGDDLFVSTYDGSTSDIYRVTAGKDITLFASGFGHVPNDCLEFSPDGTALYVADFNGDKIYKITAEAETLVSDGFEPPVRDTTVKVKKNRTIPFKAALYDENNNLVTELVYPPVINVTWNSNPITDSEEYEGLSPGQSMVGNQFEFIDGYWQFNLSVKNCCSASGLYDVTMTSGAPGEYEISPEPQAQFTIQ